MRPPHGTAGMGLQHFDWNIDDPNCGIEWRVWIRSFEIYASARHIEGNDKLAWMLYYAGPKVQRVFDNLPTDTVQEEVAFGPLAGGYIRVERNDYEEAVRRLNEFYSPKRSDTYERHLFRQLKQKVDERVDVFVMRLRCQAERCNFGNQEDMNIKDQLTEGCLSSDIRRKILTKDEEGLSNIIKMIRVEETVSMQQKLFVQDLQKNDTTVDVCKIEDTGKQNFKKDQRNYSNSNRKLECSRCGFNGHKASDDKCPAKGKRCNKCNGMNHFARKCLTKKRKNEEVESKIEGETPAKSVRKETTVNLITNQDDFKYYDDVLCVDDLCLANNDNKQEKQMIEQKTETGSLAEQVQNKLSEDLMKNLSKHVYCDDVLCIDNAIWCKVGGVDVKVVIDSGSKYNLVDHNTWCELK